MGNLSLQKSDRRYYGVTLRSILLGSLVAILVNLGAIYSGYVVRSSWSDFGHLPLVTLLLFLLLFFFNILVKSLAPKFALKPSELLVVLVMGWIGAVMQGEWLTGYFLAIITAPHYFASPENAWGEYLLRDIPDWLVLSNKGHAAEYFYEGLPPGEKIPWGAWVAPLFWWFAFLAVLIFASLCIAVILRKQWVEKERLIFPLAEVPLMLVKRSKRSLLPDLFRSRFFQVGFIASLFVICWNLLNWFSPMIPKVPLIATYTSFPQLIIARGFPAIHAKLDVFVIGFAFLTRMDVLFSIWFFHLLSILQSGVFNRVGYSIGSADPWCSFDAATGWQSFGGFLLLVLWGLWTARSHLKDVLKKAFTGKGDVDDKDELLSYRTAVFGLIFSVFYMVFWLHQAGMALKAVFVFLFVTFILYIGLSKIIAESGLVYLRGPLTAQAFTWHALGATALAGPSAAILGLSFAFFCDAKGFVMPSLVHIAKVSGNIKQRKKQISVIVGLAVLMGFVAATWYVIYEGYNFGAYNFGATSFNSSNISIWNQVVSRTRNPFGPDWRRISFLGIGAAITAGLIYLRYLFVWWPLHPVGFTVSSVYPVRDAALGIFIIWLIKLVILRIGGIRLYKKVTPLFIGLLFGYIIGVGLGFLVDVVWFNGQGHPIHGF